MPLSMASAAAQLKWLLLLASGRRDPLLPPGNGSSPAAATNTATIINSSAPPCGVDWLDVVVAISADPHRRDRAARSEAERVGEAMVASFVTRSRARRVECDAQQTSHLPGASPPWPQHAPRDEDGAEALRVAMMRTEDLLKLVARQPFSVGTVVEVHDTMQRQSCREQGGAPWSAARARRTVSALGSDSSLARTRTRLWRHPALAGRLITYVDGGWLLGLIERLARPPVPAAPLRTVRSVTAVLNSSLPLPLARGWVYPLMKQAQRGGGAARRRERRGGDGTSWADADRGGFAEPGHARSCEHWTDSAPLGHNGAMCAFGLAHADSSASPSAAAAGQQLRADEDASAVHAPSAAACAGGQAHATPLVLGFASIAEQYAAALSNGVMPVLDVAATSGVATTLVLPEVTVGRAFWGGVLELPMVSAARARRAPQSASLAWHIDVEGSVRRWGGAVSLSRRPLNVTRLRTIVLVTANSTKPCKCSELTPLTRAALQRHRGVRGEPICRPRALACIVLRDGDDGLGRDGRDRSCTALGEWRIAPLAKCPRGWPRPQGVLVDMDWRSFGGGNGSAVCSATAAVLAAARGEPPCAGARGTVRAFLGRPKLPIAPHLRMPLAAAGSGATQRAPGARGGAAQLSLSACVHVRAEKMYRSSPFFGVGIPGDAQREGMSALMANVSDFISRVYLALESANPEIVERRLLLISDLDPTHGSQTWHHDPTSTPPTLKAQRAAWRPWRLQWAEHLEKDLLPRAQRVTPMCNRPAADIREALGLPPSDERVSVSCAVSDAATCASADAIIMTSPKSHFAAMILTQYEAEQLRRRRTNDATARSRVAGLPPTFVPYNRLLRSSDVTTAAVSVWLDHQ